MKDEAFHQLLYKIRGDNWIVPERLLALDPGETTGWCLFKQGQLFHWGQQDCKKPGYKTAIPDGNAILKLFADTQPTVVVCEDYRIYAQKSETHIGKTLFTPKLIGMIDLHCEMQNLPVTYQMASAAKGFCKDDKLKRWGFYEEGLKHSRDAIRHACYFLLFNNRGAKQ